MCVGLSGEVCVCERRWANTLIQHFPAVLCNLLLPGRKCAFRVWWFSVFVLRTEDLWEVHDFRMKMPVIIRSLLPRKWNVSWGGSFSPCVAAAVTLRALTVSGPYYSFIFSHSFIHSIYQTFFFLFSFIYIAVHGLQGLICSQDLTESSRCMCQSSHCCRLQLHLFADLHLYLYSSEVGLLTKSSLLTFLSVLHSWLVLAGKMARSVKMSQAFPHFFAKTAALLPRV